MVYKEDRYEAVDAYILEGYRRLYWYAVDKNMNRADFDRKMIEVELSGGSLSYEDYFCPHKLQERLMKELLSEKYTTPRNARNSLKSYEKDRVSFSCSLGASPFSSIQSYIKNHPASKKKFEQYLTEDEIEELDEY